MRRFLTVAMAAVLCLVVLTGCEIFYGDDGKAYIRFTFEDGVSGGWLSLEGFPSVVSAGTDYEIQPGNYDGEYVLYVHSGPSDYDPYGYYDEYYYWYYTYTNDRNGTYVYSYSPYSTVGDDAFASHLELYQDEGLFNDYSNGVSYFITVKEGELFQDGDDSYFELELMWDPGDTDFGPRGVASDGARVIESTPDRIVKEYTDGRYTVRLELRRNPAVEGSIRTPVAAQ